MVGDGSDGGEDKLVAGIGGTTDAGDEDEVADGEAVVAVVDSAPIRRFSPTEGVEDEVALPTLGLPRR